MTIKYRPGIKNDCLKIAEFIYMASDGIVDYMLHGLTYGWTPVQIIAHNQADEKNHPHTYESAIVATHGDDVVGMAFSFPSSFHRITDKMMEFFPAERLDYVKEFYEARIENSLFISTISVDESHRDNGIGAKLIALTKKKAVDIGYNIVSLLVFADNLPAISVYEHAGFKIVKKIDLKENEYINHENGCLLMECKINT